MGYGMDLSTLAVLFALLLLLLGLSFTVVIDPYIRREQRRILLIIAALSLSLIIEDLWGNALFVSRSHLVLKNWLAAYGYSVRPVILILYSYIIQPKGKKWPQWVLAAINAALYGSSPLTGLCFTIREMDYAMLRGPLGLSCFVISAILLAALFLQSVFFLSGDETVGTTDPPFCCVDNLSIGCFGSTSGNGAAADLVPEHRHRCWQRILLYLAPYAICAGTRA